MQLGLFYSVIIVCLGRLCELKLELLWRHGPKDLVPEHRTDSEGLVLMLVVVLGMMHHLTA